MNGKLFKGWVALIFSAVVILAAVVLVALNWDRDGKLLVYGKDVPVVMALVMLLSAVGGVAVLKLIRLLAYGIRTVLAGRSQQKRTQMEQRLTALEKQGPPAPKQ